MTLHWNPSGNRRLSRTSRLILLATTPGHVACFRYIMLHILYLKGRFFKYEINCPRTYQTEFSDKSTFLSTSTRGLNLLCMYCTTLGVRPCRDSVIRTSAALFLHGTLWTGHQLVMAENSKVRSSFLANSSAGDEWLHSLTKTLKSNGKNVFPTEVYNL